MYSLIMKFIIIFFILTSTIDSKSSRASDGLRFLFRDEITKYNSLFFMCAN